MQHEWIIEVVQDIADYAELNGLSRTRAQIEKLLNSLQEDMRAPQPFALNNIHGPVAVWCPFFDSEKCSKGVEHGHSQDGRISQESSADRADQRAVARRCR